MYAVLHCDTCDKRKKAENHNWECEGNCNFFIE